MHERINFNEDTLNIFTDASVKKMMYGFDSASGILAMYGNQKAAEQITINRNTTNNFGEMYAILMAVELVMHIRNTTSIKPKFINIFSDSLVSVKDLREWYKGWDKDENGYLLNYMGEKVKNQNLIVNIMNTIITYDLDVSIFHIKGHVNFNKPNEVEMAKKKFEQHNGKVGWGDIDNDTMKMMLECNDYVDNSSRESLQFSENIPFAPLLLERVYPFTEEQIKKYAKLIDPRYHV